MNEDSASRRRTLNKLRNRAYRARYRAKIQTQTLECWCGNKAVKISCGSPVCQRCLDIEAALETERRQHDLRDVIGPRRSHVGGLTEYACHMPNFDVV